MKTFLFILLWLLVGLFIQPLLEMILWNWVVVDLFAGPAVTYWQMFALNWLCNLLFSKVRKESDF